MKKLATLTAGTLTSLALATPAQAHTGAHNADFVTQIVHWLSSPAHALFAVVGGIAVSALIVHFARKKRA